MQQLVQQLSTGKPMLVETSQPLYDAKSVLVRTRYSAISPGTESATVRSARKSLIGKALERPQDVRATLELLKKQGLTQTYRAVTKRLDSDSPLGYSCSGVVVGVGNQAREFHVGQRVACAGVGYANHAEYVSVPVNLCVPLENHAQLKYAAYNTLGAIALQGTRQADLRLGESCVVIGLGAIGVLTALILRASGVRVLGLDVKASTVERVKSLGINAFCRCDRSIEGEVARLTDGYGADAVIIAASAQDEDPIQFAGRLARQRGRVVVLGDVPTGFDRNPDYYPKELELRMSCSYGPGRYDPDYEEHGHDYPHAYARWTENRNMRAFQHLIASGQLNLESFTTHLVPFAKAPDAYKTILERKEPFLGVLLDYEWDEEAFIHELADQVDLASQVAYDPPVTEASNQNEETPPRRGSRMFLAGSGATGSLVRAVKYSFIGAGSYAQGSLLPNLPKGIQFTRYAVATHSGLSARRAKSKFKFERCDLTPDQILDKEESDAVIIATRHDSHAEYLIRALQHGLSVFLEKPLCLALEEYVAVARQFELSPNQYVMVGYNRRYSRLATTLKEQMTTDPCVINYRVNAGAIPRKHWSQDRLVGGGRILGEACHFIDLTTYLAGSLPVSVRAQALPDPQSLNDVVVAQIRFENRSLATIHYLSNGSSALEKERIEVFQSGASAVIENFHTLRYYSPQGRVKRLRCRDKGQKQMLYAFLNAVSRDLPAAHEEILRVWLATYAVEESLRSGREVALI
ncbi:MAG: bi-domain-containing oxidoreductase [Planctomycetia bacterium]|nr:bi-domain-containing oxidoreductase [Planctomycetia bacterium]